MGDREIGLLEAVETAQGLCVDQRMDSEYVRGQAELICELFGMDVMDHKEVVIVAIADQSRRR